MRESPQTKPPPKAESPMEMMMISIQQAVVFDDGWRTSILDDIHLRGLLSASTSRKLEEELLATSQASVLSISRWAGGDKNIRVNMGLWGWVYGCCCDWSQDRRFLSLCYDAMKKGYKLWNQGYKKQEFEESWIVDQFYGDGRNPDSKYLISWKKHIWGGCECLT